MPTMVTIAETGSNTGVFESQDGDVSEITVREGANDGDTFTIGYADERPAGNRKRL